MWFLTWQVRKVRGAILAIVLCLIGGLLGADGRYWRLPLPLGLDELSAEIPPDNVPTVAKVDLGRRLFFDKRLSIDGTVSCTSCHDPAKSFTDGRPLAVGIGGQKGRRNTPTLLNRLFSTAQMLDGRFASLEGQVRDPLLGRNEMGNPSLAAVVRRLKRTAEYPSLFQNAFGSASITAERLAQAIASYERTLLVGDSPFDRYEVGGDPRAISDAARRGLRVFRTKGECFFCHNGFNLTDEFYHRLSVGLDKVNPDLGYFWVTRREEDKGRFKTPTLRNVAETGPYMHDGSLRTLEEVVDFYNRGGLRTGILPPEIQPLGLTEQEQRDLVEFLKSLTGKPVSP